MREKRRRKRTEGGGNSQRRTERGIQRERWEREGGVERGERGI